MRSEVLFFISFLIGSVPFGLLIAKLFKVENLQKHGSGNIGATNVSRVAGFWPAGFLTFLLDLLKGTIPAFVFGPLGKPLFESIQGFNQAQLTIEFAWFCGLFAVAGHCFSPWVKFKGGKGVATGLGVISVLSPIAAIFGIAAFAIAFIKTKTSSLGSLSGLITATIVHLIIHKPEDWPIAGAPLVLLILFRHDSNLRALLDGKEKSFDSPA